MFSKITLILFLIVAGGILSFACSSTSHENHEMPMEKGETAEKQTYRSTGIIKAIDAEKGTVTIDHEDIPGYMSAMEMTEPVADKSLLDAVKVGDKVEFEIERTGSEIVYTKFTKVGEDETVKAFSIYKTNCAECHGEKGKGVEDKGISFLKGHALDHSEADFIRRVTNGKSDEMPAFKDKLSEAEIRAVVKYVREVIQKDAVKEDSGGHHH